MLDYYEDHPHRPYRAQQIWLILIGKALNRQLTTHKEVSQILGYEGSGTLANTLGHIAYFCQQNQLPGLTTLVVNEVTGEPGDGIPVERGDIHRQQAKVFTHKWFKLIPPTPEEFEEAWEIGESA